MELNLYLAAAYVAYAITQAVLLNRFYFQQRNPYGIMLPCVVLAPVLSAVMLIATVMKTIEFLAVPKVTKPKA